MTTDISRFRNEDLLLRTTRSINPSVFNINKYEAFLDALCSDREYQKEAIRDTCNFLFGAAYKNTRDLAEANYQNNSILQEKYADFSRFEKSLEFPNKLSCSLDLATGTGKSFVMYGIARIALAEGKIDRVLVLCPSNTIEAGLISKFRALSKDKDLADLLPRNAVIKTPHIINATESITSGDICVENIHATYQTTKSAITDSLTGNGSKTLVLNDEAHHIYTPTDTGLKKWKEFLISDEFKFDKVVGLTGTCYIKNDYFTDVISRYSLKQAIEDGFVKNIKYVIEDSPGDQYEKWQKIYKNHKSNKTKYRRTKPITIIVTKDINTCKKVEEELITFLSQTESISKENASRKVMRVHTPRSSKEDRGVAANILALRNGEPDSKDSPIEWITSVSMLTEGWDIQNVFQIYPHEKRAFDSKLLIAQVLGRGLRVPDAYKGEKPMVTVYNHDAWSQSIKGLVNEILEIERKAYSFPVNKEPDYNFSIHHIDYTKSSNIVETEQESEYKFDMEIIALAGQSDEIDKKTEYEDVLSGDRTIRDTRIRTEMYPTNAIIFEVSNKFKAIDLELDTNYADKYSEKWLRKLIKKSLDKINYKGNKVSKENKQRILSAFGNLKRTGSKSIRYEIKPKNVYKIDTQKRPKDSIGFATLRKGTASIFFDELSKSFDSELKQAISDIEKDDKRPVRALSLISNRYFFKTCQAIVITHSDPEYKFIKGLVEDKNADKINSWIKSTDIGFYEIEYSYSKGDYSKRSTFNPDFFINLGDEIIVVEIKGDEEISEPSAENRGKRKAAIAHFNILNELQSDIKYHFCFLTPKDYDLFFEHLRKGKAIGFQSSLDVELMK